MATLTIAGDYTSALTHFALYGLSLMVEQKHPGTVTVGWSQEGQPRAQMHAEGVRRRNCRVRALLRFFPGC